MKTYQHKVQYYETDQMKMTHHSNYIRFMEEARIEFLNKIGWGYDIIEKKGIVSPVVSISCEYKKPTTFADIIDIDMNIVEITATKLTIGYTMMVNNEVVCLATSSHCFLDKDARPIIIKRQMKDFYESLLSYQ